MPTTINTNVSSLNDNSGLNPRRRRCPPAAVPAPACASTPPGTTRRRLAIAISALDTQVKGHQRRSTNANDGISLAQTAEGAVHRDRRCCSACANWRYGRRTAPTAPSRPIFLDTEFQQLSQEITGAILESDQVQQHGHGGRNAGAQVFRVERQHNADDIITVTTQAVADPNIVAVAADNRPATPPPWPPP